MYAQAIGRSGGLECDPCALSWPTSVRNSAVLRHNILSHPLRVLYSGGNIDAADKFIAEEILLCGKMMDISIPGNLLFLW
jgi:hypothetical protein